MNMRVAAVQASPVFLDREATIKRAQDRLRAAAAGGAGLVVFGEGFLPGHPTWYQALAATDPAAMKLTEQLVDQALTIPGPDVDELASTARELGVDVVMGIVERPDRTKARIHAAQLAIRSDGTIAGVRRKLTPAVGERIVFSPGDAADVRTFRLSCGEVACLLGGEAANPLFTAALRETGAKLVVSAWPAHFNKPQVMSEIMTITARAIAYQNTADVISVRCATSEESLDRIARDEDQRALLGSMIGDPGSLVVAPRGRVVAGPLADEEGILFADLDLAPAIWPELVNRQYDRADIFGLTVDGAPVGDTRPPDLVRTLIDERFGDQLDDDEKAALQPLVAGVLARSRALAEADVTTADPRRAVFADDSRA